MQHSNTILLLSSVVLALKSDDYVAHPLLDKLKECSTDPH